MTAGRTARPCACGCNQIAYGLYRKGHGPDVIQPAGMTLARAEQIAGDVLEANPKLAWGRPRTHLEPVTIEGLVA